MKDSFIILLIIIISSCNNPKKKNIEIIPEKEKKEINKTEFKKNKISTETQLNFVETEKRGIKNSHGIIYYVENDLQTLTAYEKGKTKWKTNIIETLGKPTVGKSEIRFIQLKKETVDLVYGKHNYASVNIINGKVTDFGTD